MKSRHLTDEAVQEFLDGNAVINDTEAYIHLQSCAECRALLESYQALYKQLGREPAFRLPGIFAEKILEKIRSPRSNVFLSPSAEIALMAGGLLAALGGMILFVDLRPILNGIGNFALPPLGLKSSLLEPVRNLFSGIDGGITLAPFAALALALVALLDRVFQKRRHHKTT